MTHVLTKVTELTDLNFEEFIQNTELPVMVSFYGDFCGPCEALEPAIAKIAKDVSGRAIVVRMRVNDNPETPVSLRVRVVPTILYMKNGAVLDRHIGGTTLRNMRERLLALS